MQFVHAQFNLGIKGGVNFANQTNAYYGAVIRGNSIAFDYFDGKSITRYHAGLFTDVKITRSFTFRPQIIYSAQGFEIPQILDYAGNLIGTDIKILLHYINTPLQVLYSPSLSFGKPWIGLGPYAGVLLGGKIKTSDGSSSLRVGNKDDDDYKRFDFGISGSVGFLFKNGILFGADYNLGLTTVDRGNDKAKNTVWSIYAGYKYIFR
jgi:hypothetical protein